PSISPSSPYATLFRSHLPLMRSALLVASELLAHRPWGWFDIDAKERLYDYAGRDFETASRHWSALDTKASQLMAANAVLLGLVVDRKSTRLNSSHVKT